MINYFAGRMHKMKADDLKGMQYHNQRERESRTNKSIDKSRSHLNYDLVHGRERIDYEDKINRRIEKGVKSKRKIRSDAVRCNQWIITSDKSFFDRVGEKEEQRFFAEAYRWFAERYGKKNIAFATIHKDEHTPHMHLGVVPITPDGRLSSKELFGRKQLRDIQEEFPRFIQSRGFELERGIPSDQKHEEPRRWKVQQLREEERRLDQKIGRLMDLEDRTRSIFEMKAERVKGWLGDSGKLKVREADWEQLKSQAIHVIGLRNDQERLTHENNQYRDYLSQVSEKIQRMKQGLEQIRELSEENRELKKHIKELELKLDLIEQELDMEFDLEDEMELEDDEQSPRKRRGKRPKLKTRQRPADRKFGRHMRERKQHRKQEPKQRQRGRQQEQIRDLGRF